MQEARGYLTKKKALQWEAVLSQGEAVFVDCVSLFVTFCYCFYCCKLLFYCSMAGGVGRTPPVIGADNCRRVVQSE